MKITLSLQTDLYVKNLHVVSGENRLSDHWAVNKNLSVNLVNGPYLSGLIISAQPTFS